MHTQQEDILNSFEKKIARPHSYYLVLGTSIATILLYLVIFGRGLIYMLRGMEAGFLFYTFILFLYPLLGIVLYRSGKKAGWFILSHFGFSSLIFMFFGLAIALFEEASGWSDSAIFCMIGIFIACFISVFFLFRYYFTDYFGLTRTSILGVIIITVIVPIVLGLIASVIY